MNDLFSFSNSLLGFCLKVFLISLKPIYFSFTPLSFLPLPPPLFISSLFFIMSFKFFFYYLTGVLLRAQADLVCYVAQAGLKSAIFLL